MRSPTTVTDHPPQRRATTVLAHFTDAWADSSERAVLMAYYYPRLDQEADAGAAGTGAGDGNARRTKLQMRIMSMRV